MMFKTLAVAAAFAVGAIAQTHTDCNPLDKTDCPVDQAIGMTNWTWYPSAGSLNTKLWNDTGYTGVSTTAKDLNFTMKKTGDAPTIKSMGYFFYGTVSVVAQAAPGQGIISAITCLSDDLDEIDYEFKGGNSSFVFSNWYGKYNNTGPQGGMTAGDGEDLKVSFNPTTDYHNYTIVWTNETIQWIVDGNMLREVKSSDSATQGGKTFPQTPMRLYLGNWAGGDSSAEGTVSWAGGKTDWSKAPFVMSVKSVYISDASNGTSYTFGDKSGSASSIKIDKSKQSTFAAAATNKNSDSDPDSSDSPGITDKAKASFNGLSNGAKIGIIAGAIGVVVILLLIFAFCCIKQRRAGKKEKALADAEFQKQEAEVMQYRQQGRRQRFTFMPQLR